MSHPSDNRPPFRGEVWLTEFDPVRANEQGGLRPAIVLSTDALNRSRVGLVAVVPLTSRIRDIPMHVVIEPPEGGLRVPSDALCEYLRILTRERLVERWGAVAPVTLDAIGERVRLLLGL